MQSAEQPAGGVQQGSTSAKTPAAAPEASQPGGLPTSTPWKTPPPVFAQAPTTPEPAIAPSGWQNMYASEEVPEGELACP